MAFFAIDELIALGHGRSLAKKAAAFFRNSFSCRSSRTSALSFAISADSEAFLRSWSVACAFLYLATQLPTVWGTRSYDEATEEMVRSFSTTSRTTCSLNSSEYLAAGIVFILSTHGKKNSPVRETPRTPGFAPFMEDKVLADQDTKIGDSTWIRYGSDLTRGTVVGCGWTGVSFRWYCGVGGLVVGH